MDLFKRVNSKGFLLSYLVVFGCLLSFMLFRQSQLEQDTRDIPSSLSSVLVSPPSPIPQFVLFSSDRLVLTDQSLRGKWSFIYFTHPHCRPQCEPILTVMANLQQLFASNQIQFILLNVDNQTDDFVATDLISSLRLYSGDPSVIESLTQSFDFLSLRTDYVDGYTLEQQHSIFLTDPKGRVYARFEPPFTSLDIQQSFFSLRAFYARTE